MLGPGGEQFPDYSNVTGVVNPNIGITGKQGVWSGDYEGDAYGTKSIADYIKEGAITTGKNVIDAAADKAGLGGWQDILFGPSKVGDQEVQWKIPLQLGTAIGAADYLTRSDDTMPAQLAIDPSRFATAEAAKADPNLRFKPQEQYTLKDGGRIGYDDGKSVINYNEDPEYRGWKKMYEQNPSRRTGY